MPLDIVVGTQWGDEGKGRIVDVFSQKAEYVARYNGGDNAGHTVTVNDQVFKLHLIPSGLIHEHTIGVLGGGMVVNLQGLAEEIEQLRALGIKISPERLKLSPVAHIVTAAHIALDGANEQARGDQKIGTTKRGIGPAYSDKTKRQGLRMADLLDVQQFEEKFVAHIESANEILNRLYDLPTLEIAPLKDQARQFAETFGPYVADTSLMLSQALKDGKNVLAEGAQGTLLDLDLGSYPFVTSSNPTATGVLSGLGIGIAPVGEIAGVTKAFQTRVGEGGFPTELEGDMANRLRGTGENPWDEFGTTTGRPRRVGWLDLVLLRYAARVNSLTGLAVTKLDILSGFDELKLCTAYKAQENEYAEVPYGPFRLNSYEPVYKELPGWEDDLTGVRTWEDLPDAAKAYLLYIEDAIGVPVKWVSVGPEREQFFSR